MKIKRTTALLLAAMTISLSVGCSKNEEPFYTEDIEESDFLLAEDTTESDTTTFDIEERVAEAKKHLSEISEKESSEEELSENAYEVTNFRFDISDRFEIFEEDDDFLKFKSKDGRFDVGISNAPLYNNARASAYANGLANSLKSEGEDSEVGEYDNPYMECAYIKATDLSNYFNIEESDDHTNLCFYYARNERDVISFLICCSEDDDLSECLDYLLSSFVHVGDEKISDEGGTAENDFLKVDFSEDWFIYDMDDTSDNFDEESDIRESIKLRYSLVDTEALMLSGITLTGIKSSTETYEDQADAMFERADSSEMMTNVKKETGEILGHKARTVSFDLEDETIGDLHFEEYFFENNDTIYMIAKSYPTSDAEDCIKDMDEVIAAVELKATPHKTRLTALH